MDSSGESLLEVGAGFTGVWVGGLVWEVLIFYRTCSPGDDEFIKRLSSVGWAGRRLHPSTTAHASNMSVESQIEGLGLSQRYMIMD